MKQARIEEAWSKLRTWEEGGKGACPHLKIKLSEIEY